MSIPPPSVCRTSIPMLWQMNAPPAAQCAAEVRKRLLRSAQSIDAEADPGATLLIGQWLDSHHSQVLPGEQQHAAVKGYDLDLG